MVISNIDSLISLYESGEKFEYTFFWGHRKNKNTVTKSCFSQWYESAFVHESIKYKTAEHFMMAQKAKLFNDKVSFLKIIKTEEPARVKKLGREVQNFNDVKWVENRLEIVKKANLLKFEQSPKLKKYLLNTGDSILVEASPVDPVWGIGLASDFPNVEDPRSWKGQNLLGFTLMSVREILKKT